MTKRGRKNDTTNVALKVAVVMSRKTQRALALRAGIAEVRFSEIVCGRGAAANPDERRAISKALGQPQSELFPVQEAIAS